MKSIIYSVVAIFTSVCFALAQQEPDSVVAYDSNPSSLQLMAQTGPNNTVTLSWRGDPTSPGFTVYESIGRHGTYFLIVTVGPNVQSYTLSGFAVGVPYSFKVADRLDPQSYSNEVRVRFTQ